MTAEGIAPSPSSTPGYLGLFARSIEVDLNPSPSTDRA